MNVRQPGMGKSRTIDDLHCLRLVARLDELVRENALTMPTAGLDVDHPTMAASPGSGRLTLRMLVLLDDTRRKPTKRETLHRARRALSQGKWQRWRQRAEGGFQLAFVSSH